MRSPDLCEHERVSIPNQFIGTDMTLASCGCIGHLHGPIPIEVPNIFMDIFKKLHVQLVTTVAPARLQVPTREQQHCAHIKMCVATVRGQIPL